MTPENLIVYCFCVVMTLVGIGVAGFLIAMTRDIWKSNSKW